MNKIQLNAEFEEKQNAALTPVQKLTKTQIIELIEKARLHLTKDVQCMGMTTKHSDFNCKINPTSSKREFSMRKSETTVRIIELYSRGGMVALMLFGIQNDSAIMPTLEYNSMVRIYFVLGSNIDRTPNCIDTFPTNDYVTVGAFLKSMDDY